MFSKNILIIFKDRKKITLNHEFWSDKFKTKYQVFQFFLNDYLKLTNKKIIFKINELINEKKINTVLLEGDHAHVVDYDFIKEINQDAKKGIFLGDDMVWHNLNLITSQSCDFVFTSCPISALKFQEIGIPSLFVPVECNGKILKDYKLDKIYDVLHFGREKTKRSEYIDFLVKNNIKVKSVSPYHKEADTFEKLAKLINQSKIVLNFSESSNGNRKFNPLSIFKSFYQLKGRIQMTGLCNSLCITEFTPSLNMMYDNNVVPYFKNKNECLSHIKFYLGNAEELLNQTKKFHAKSLMYEDKNYINIIENFMNKSEILDKKQFKAPLWYNKIFLNQTLRLRAKRGLIISFFNESLINIFYKKQKNIINKISYVFSTILLYFRYLPFTIINIFTKKNN